ncbi:hypothetical protein LTR70_007434 [Exophiala xenobiotica]|uniref:AAA+ ATPase domain-containing protein n=1 Tax=Lithohypha guttulata TaxID=1690604 RepID=A0ABR0K4N6_9EURO|nr:hypothetical protein LTR24_006974 [Lithohypha guttulata]KAK5313791.1 hypothetical protein LTR70_007434 [Exophiala xenobiotica]
MSKAPNNNKAARTNTVCPVTPPSSPTMQSPKSSKPAGALSAPYGPVVLQQTAPVAERGQRVTNVPQVPPQLAITGEHVQQFLDLLRTAVAPNTPPTSSSSVAAVPAAPADGPPDQLSSSAMQRASKLTYLSVREVWNKIDNAYKTVDSPTVKKVNDNDEFLFVVRTRAEKSTDKTIKYIDIKSTVIRDVLRLVLKDVRGISLKEERPSIDQSFLFHFLREITERHTASQKSSSQGDTASKHLGVLLDYLESEYRSPLERVMSLLKGKEITYDLLWALFKPNAEVFTTCPGTGAPRCVRLHFGEERKRNNGTKYFHLEGHCLDFDGEILGEATVALSIDEFRGAKAIDLLSAYPLAFHRRPEDLRKQLIDCSRKFVSLLGVHHQCYEGKAFYVDKRGRRITETVTKSRIMVDASFFRKRNPNYQAAKVEPSSEAFDFWDLSTICAEEAPLQAITSDPKSLSEQDLLICSPTVYGYSLKRKQWLEFAVAYTSDIDWDESSFGRLAIPADTKKAIQALSEAHLGRDSDVHFEDFVAGKGRGLIVLLHGPPGVGKTLTAETISEHVRRPFYTISAGDLGTTPDVLEKNLSEILELSSHWKATLLLDEADVFVEQRATHDIQRNALVCIFLRKLEYYDGIMFFTTNRVKTIDEAIASRIHLSLRYGDLREMARKKVWTSQLAKAVTRYGEADYSSDDLNHLAGKKLNGRQVRYSPSAQAMAAFDKKAVNFSYLTRAIDLNEQFQCDFRGAGHFDNEHSYM